MRVAGFVLAGGVMLASAAFAQVPPGEKSANMTEKLINMLAAEAQFFSGKVAEQKDEIDKLKAAGCEAQPSMKPGESK